MAVSQRSFALQEGYVHHWLVAGPQVIPVAGGDDGAIDSLPARIIHRYHPAESGIVKEPVERGPIDEGRFTIGDYEGAWSYVHCQEDHFIDHSAVYGPLVYFRSWAFTELFSDEKQDAVLTLTSNGPVDVWVNDAHVYRHEHFQAPDPQSVAFLLSLAPGLNKVLIQFENAGSGVCPDFMALRVCQANGPSPEEARDPIVGVHVEIPTLIYQTERRDELEDAFQKPYLERDVFTQPDKINICWPAGVDKSVFVDVRLEAMEGMIYAQAEVSGKPGDVLFLSFASQLSSGRYKAFLMPRAWEYYERDLRVSKDIPFWVIGDNSFSTTPYGTLQDRCLEVWQHAAQFKGNIYAEISRMALGLWQSVDLQAIRNAIERVNRRESGSVETLIALFRMLINYGRSPKFPRGLKDDLKACILGYRYWLDEPGTGDMEFTGESEQILFHTCEILAGQRYREQVFLNNNQTGKQHREHAEGLALAWLQERAARGFPYWNSDHFFAEVLPALTLLVDYADNPEIGELAAILMDKIFYALALHSFQGVLAASSGQTTLDAVRGGYLQETAGVTRVMWGMGIYNQHLAAPVSLACARQYELPLIFVDIARATPEALWTREKHGVHSPDSAETVSISTFRTPDGLLSSAQDYIPGQPGRGEHIWQATLGPGATVFVNHPANASRNEALGLNYWLGNRVLPRVGQWKDSLVAIYRLPEDDWMGFTHAYFPTFAFDEYVIREDWGFARKGDGFLAITASGGLQLVEEGQEAMRELRSPGSNTIWLCQMGRAVHDGSFADFQEQILARKPVFKGLSVQWQTIRGDAITFGWEGAFNLNGEDMPLLSEKHYESLYGVADFPAAQMDIQFGERILRLDLSTPGEGGDVS